MSGDQLNLDAIGVRVGAVIDAIQSEHGGLTVEEDGVLSDDFRALCGEVRRLRAKVAKVHALPHRSAWFEGSNGMPTGHARDVVSYDRLMAALED